MRTVIRFIVHVMFLFMILMHVFVCTTIKTLPPIVALPLMIGGLCTILYLRSETLKGLRK